jgi:hypothetical protein
VEGTHFVAARVNAQVVGIGREHLHLWHSHRTT